MFTVTLKDTELYNPNTREFSIVKGLSLNFEHSLFSISKWEEKWHKSYFKAEEKTPEEALSYLQCMCVENASLETLQCLTKDQWDSIQSYLNDSHTATTFKETVKKASSQYLTSEYVYYQMFSLRIDKECEHWHIQRLLTLIKIFSHENEPKKKISKKQNLANVRARNKANRAKYKSRG